MCVVVLCCGGGWKQEAAEAASSCASEGVFAVIDHKELWSLLWDLKRERFFGRNWKLDGKGKDKWHDNPPMKSLRFCIRTRAVAFFAGGCHKVIPIRFPTKSIVIRTMCSATLLPIVYKFVRMIDSHLCYFSGNSALARKRRERGVH